jgi:predicted phage tail protein
MNYLRIHDAIIDRAHNRTLTGYVEKHHVIPRCLGGTDDKANLVALTAREHFIIHKLLCEIYPNETKLIYAYWMMSRNISNSKYNREYSVSSKDYERARRLFSDISSKQQLGKTLTDEHKKALSIAAKTRRTRSAIKHSEKTKQHLSSLWKGTTRSLEDRQKISDGQRGKQRKIVTCPHCGKSGGNNGMTHWHFDNCKFKN